jgi:hypothetical protein
MFVTILVTIWLEVFVFKLDVYIRYKYEEDAGKAETNLNNRFYAGRPLYAELSPVTDFGEGFFILISLLSSV